MYLIQRLIHDNSIKKICVKTEIITVLSNQCAHCPKIKCSKKHIFKKPLLKRASDVTSDVKISGL